MLLDGGALAGDAVVTGETAFVDFSTHTGPLHVTGTWNEGDHHVVQGDVIQVLKTMPDCQDTRRTEPLPALRRTNCLLLGGRELPAGCAADGGATARVRPVPEVAVPPQGDTEPADGAEPPENGWKEVAEW